MSEARMSIVLPDGTRTPEVTIPEMRAAVNAVKDGKRPRQDEMFTSDETGETAAAQELRSFIERVERLEEEKATIGDDIKDVYGEAKGRGF